MAETGLPAQGSPVASSAVRLSDALQVAGPPLLLGLRLWASVCLALYVAFWLELDNAYWAGTTAAIVCQPHLGASLRKGWFRLIGTLIGAVAIVVLTACFPQDRAPFLIGLALWCSACALVATLLRNFAAYAAALAGYTAAIIALDQLGATGGLNGQTLMLGVDLATLFARLSAEIARRFTGTLVIAGADFEDTQTIRRELVRQVIALDPVSDEALGESAQFRYHSPVLQNAVDGLFAALASWRTAAVLLARSSEECARQEADAVLARCPSSFVRGLSKMRRHAGWPIRRCGAGAVRGFRHSKSARLRAQPGHSH